ncbi:uncharacterized protein N7483_011359 [Penicillium malachiteum]|uniref:uncharacterized protein n=1 Tax=Penicillium malachiteum TaxID=1324776 RepID=UPI0025495317|nr:uncharacterized protein N7483_011359 [Penicillium malachiteum]KAJ5714178.1 hypothetical protein N7483_011359 [Penicillium malachiteum]
MNDPIMDTNYDVIIVGAGLSGINAAYRLQSQFPDLRYAILEARENLGGTWDFFKYPGIRSDSPLLTYGYSWHHWNKDHLLGEGSEILQYMDDAATEHNIKEKILFKHRLFGAEWSSLNQSWSLNVHRDGGTKTFSARFLVLGTGYYNYEQALEANIPGIEKFQGQVIHPQFWPESLDYANKKIVVIGSGATAITLIPKLAAKAEVTMLQRSPSYVMSIQNKAKKTWLHYILPDSMRYKFERMRSLFITRLFVLLCRAYPDFSIWLIKKGVTKLLPENIPYDPHFKPSYIPWEQRFCVCPDGDFFDSLRSGRANIKTDTIKSITSDGIELNSGDKLDADIIVTATGLSMLFAGGTSFVIDRVPYVASEKFAWRGMMLQDLPNAAYLFGYTNASWTPGVDATSVFFCRLLKEMKRLGMAVAVPRLGLKDAQDIKPRKMFGLTSTYVAKAEGILPKAGDRAPWLPRESYFQDWKFAKSGSLEGLELVSEKA